MERTKCPICRKGFRGILKHLLLVHDVQDLDNLRGNVEIVEKNEKRVREFGKYVDELHSRIKKGEITSEKFRELISKWDESNP